MRRNLIASGLAAAVLAVVPATATAQLNLGGLVGSGGAPTMPDPVDTVGGVTETLPASTGGFTQQLTGTVGSVTGGGTETVSGLLEGLTGQVTDAAGNLVGTVNALTGQVLDPTGLVIGLLGPGGQIVPVVPGSIAPVVAPTPGGGTGPGANPAPVDQIAPTVRVIANRSRARIVSWRGIRAKVRCSEACAVLTALELDARTARALRLTRRNRPLVLASRTVIIRRSGANRVVALKPSARVRRALGRAGRTIRLRVRAVGFDAFANHGPVVSRRVPVTR